LHGLPGRQDLHVETRRRRREVAPIECHDRGGAAVVAPCHRGASPPSVLRRDFRHRLLIPADAIVETSRRLLRANVSEGLAPMTTYGGYRRTTGRSDPRERLWVYGRAGLPCRRCGMPIRLRKQGDDARLTYWCPACQEACVLTFLEL
jgi:hypothetical protein